MTIPLYSPYKETFQKKVLSGASQRLLDGVHIDGDIRSRPSQGLLSGSQRALYSVSLNLQTEMA
jgi:hypothetical protein